MSQPETPRTAAAWEVFTIFLRLGLTSFGGPVAHLGYFHEAFVNRRKWLSAESYAEIVALCQFLPGPASSQVGLAIGLRRAGVPGALAAWLGFTAPSAIALILFALGLGLFEGAPDGWLRGLKIAALAIVAQALWGMARTLTPDRPRILIALGAAIVMLIVPLNLMQLAVIAITAVIGAVLLPASEQSEAEDLPGMSRMAGIACLAAFFVLLAALPLAAALTGDPSVSLADRFYRTGALVFGGGHVVLPLLQTELVAPGLVSRDAFLAGYGAAQAIPGPLFAFSAYLGALVSGWGGALIGLVAIYVPSFLLVFGILPFWPALKTRPRARAALAGTNAGVVGLLLAALYDPVFTSAITQPLDMALALAALAAVAVIKLPPWLVVIACAAAGMALPV